MGKLKKLAGETVLYGMGSIIPRFLNFLLVPLHTSVFQADEYGVITKVFAYVAVVNTLYMFGMETAYFRFANSAATDEKKIFNLTQTAVIGISGLLTILFVFFANPIAGALSISDRPDVVIWLALIMFIDAAVAIPFARLRLRKKAVQFATAKIINIAIIVGLNVYFLLFASADSADISMVFLANLLANAFYVFVFARVLLSWRPSFDRTLSPTIFSYAYPIMLTGLAGITNEMFSRITLEKWLPDNFYRGRTREEALGIFGASYKLAVLMGLAIQGFRYAAEPFFFSNAREKNSPQLFASVNHYFIIVCCLILLGVCLNLDLLKYFLARPVFWEGLHVVPILMLSYLFAGVYYNFSVWFKLTDKTYYGTMITVAGAIITIAANYLLIPVAGYTGSSWAAVICFFSMATACYVLGQRYYPIPYRVGKGLAYIAATFLIIYGIRGIDPLIQNQVLQTSLHILVILVFAVVVYLLERRGSGLNRA